MYITENTNLRDSAICLGFIRTALVEQLKESNASQESIDFISESAKDCEVLSLAMYGKVYSPDNVMIAETILISELKKFIVENVVDFDFNNNYKLSQFISEIDGLSMYDTDSMSYINEGVSNEDIPILTRVRNVVSASGDNLHKGWNTFTAYLNKVKKGAIQTAKSGKDVYKSDAGVKHFSHAVGIASVIGVGSFLAYKAYQNYFSKSARQCADKTGTAKIVCMKNAKNRSIDEQINLFKKLITTCTHTRDPEACRANINKKIQLLQAKK